MFIDHFNFCSILELFILAIWFKYLLWSMRYDRENKRKTYKLNQWEGGKLCDKKGRSQESNIPIFFLGANLVKFHAISISTFYTLILILGSQLSKNAKKKQTSAICIPSYRPFNYLPLIFYFFYWENVYP